MLVTEILKIISTYHAGFRYYQGKSVAIHGCKCKDEANHAL